MPTDGEKVYVLWIDGECVGVELSVTTAKTYFEQEHGCPGTWHESPAVHPITKYEFCEQGLHSIEEYEIGRLAAKRKGKL